MLQKLYKKIFYSAHNLSILKTIMYNFFILRTVTPKVYLGKGTSILNQGGNIYLNGKVFFDCKNAGQFFYDSHIVLEKNSSFHIKGDVNFFSAAQIKCFENAKLIIGKNTYFSGHIVIHSKIQISIGNNCSISWGGDNHR